MAAKPIVLDRDVGERALAGQLQRRHPGRLIALNDGVHLHRPEGNLPGGMEALRTADEIRDVNTRYHDVAADGYDSKWGIDCGEIGQAQVLGKLQKVFGSAHPGLEHGFDRSLEMGGGTGYLSLRPLA